MKSRKIVLAIAIAIGFVVGFWFYGMGRTMRETVSFNITASLCGLFLVVFFSLIGVLTVILVKGIVFAGKKWPMTSLFAAFIIALLIGSLISEASLLQDEARFAAEVSKANPQTIYSRARAWPNGDCSLIFIPGKGIHSTD